MSHAALEAAIEAAWEARDGITTATKGEARDAIEATKGYVGTGGIVNMSATDHMGLDLSSFRMLEIKNGDWSLVQ